MIGTRRASESMNRPTNKQLFAWRYHDQDRLGRGGDALFKVQPTRISSPHAMWTQISCGLLHTAAISSNGELFSWDLGLGRYSKLGNGDYTGRIPKKVEIAGGHAVVKVACGRYHTAAVTASGQLFTWYVCSCTHFYQEWQ